MTPAYYAVTLADHGVRVEVTGTARAGILRFTFLRGGEASLLVHANRKTQGAIPGGPRAGGRGRGARSPSRTRSSGSTPGAAGRPGSPATWSSGSRPPSTRWGPGAAPECARERRSRPGEGDVFGGYARFRVRAGQVVVVRAGTSFTSPEAAAAEPRGRDRKRRLRRGPRPGRVGLGERPRPGPRAGRLERRAAGLLHVALPRAPAAAALQRRGRRVPALRGRRGRRAGGRLRLLRRLLALGHLPRPAPAARAPPAGAGAALRALAPRQGGRRAASCRTSPAGTATRAR